MDFYLHHYITLFKFIKSYMCLVHALIYRIATVVTWLKFCQSVARWRSSPSNTVTRPFQTSLSSPTRAQIWCVDGSCLGELCVLTHLYTPVSFYNTWITHDDDTDEDFSGGKRFQVAFFFLGKLDAKCVYTILFYCFYTLLLYTWI